MFNGLPRGVVWSWSVNAKNLQMLYNFVAQSDSVKDMSLLMGYKSTAQVAAKIAHLEANLML